MLPFEPSWFRQEQWNVGLIKQSIQNIVDAGITQPIRWLTPSKNSFIADPHVQILPDGQFQIWVEKFDYQSFKGSIVQGTCNSENFTQIVFSPCLELNTHLSYPQSIFWGGEHFLFCENWESGGIAVFSRSDIHSPWVYRSNILCEQRVVDPTPFFYQGFWYLFYTLQDQRPNQSLRLMYSSNLLAGWKHHPQNTISDNSSGARPAGAIIKLSDGRLIRPGQNCSKTYGGSIGLFEIQQLTPTTYIEKQIRELPPQKGEWQWGLHTINPMGNDYTLVDGKRWLYSPVEVFRKLSRQKMLQKRRLL